MFGVNYSKLKTNLKLSIQRLKLIESKKTENAKKSTKEIADYLSMNKVDRARIKVEHIIREDYMVEGMEIVEMYCDLLLARIGLLEHIKVLEPDLQEPVSSVLWACPRLESECPELKVVANELERKFGKDYANECKSGHMTTINSRLMQKLNEQAPSNLLVEKYLVEIAQSHKVPYKPDPKLAVQDYDYFYNFDHSQPQNNDKSNNNNASGGAGSSGGGSGGPGPTHVSHIGFNIPQASSKPKPKQTDPSQPPPPPPAQDDFHLDLPNVPTNNDSSSFDDLAKRFENLKKK